MKLRELFEESPHKPVDLKGAAQIYHEKCDWLDVKKPLYRWRNSWAGSAHDSETRDRPGGYRYPVQKYMLELPSWKEYPNRRKSIFCSTKKKVADGLKGGRDLFCVYPYKDQTMGLTPKLDFNELVIPAAGEYVSLAHLATLLLGVIYHITGETWDNAWEIDVPTSIKKIQNLEETPETSEADAKLIKWVKTLPEGLSPEKLGFKKVSSSKFRLPPKAQEVWFEGKYLIVPETQLTKFIEEVNAAE